MKKRLLDMRDPRTGLAREGGVMRVPKIIEDPDAWSAIAEPM